jgi:hypothetical protein
MIERLIAVLFLAWSVAAWANPCALPDSGMGGTGHRAESGIGGTGATAASGMGGTGIDGGMGGSGHRPGDGMGGTGILGDAGLGGTGIAGGGMGGTGAVVDGSGMGGTGVVGVITGFGSICVNGLEIHYDARTPVAVDGRAGSSRQLAIGQMVAVQATGSAPSLMARRIELNAAVVGPVEWVAPGGQSFRALGQTVRLAAAGKAPALGEFVRVHGLRDSDGSVRATHVERVAAEPLVTVSGVVDSVSGRVARIGGLTAVGAANLPEGASVRLTGRLAEGGVLEVRQFEVAPEMRLTAKADRLSLQGIVRKVEGNAISLGYARVEGGAETMRNVEVGQWVRVDVARRPDGRLDVQRLRLDAPRGGRDVGARPRVQERGEARHDRDEGREEGDESREERHEHKPDSEHKESRNKSDRLDKGQDFEKMSDSDRKARVEKAEKPERVEKVEKPEKVELPEKIELPERPETPEKIEIERVERRDD